MQIYVLYVTIYKRIAKEVGLMKVRKKVKSFLRLFSPILVPVITLSLSYIISSLPCVHINRSYSDKADLVVSLDGTFIGVLVTIFTIYVSFPLAEKIRKRFKESKHQGIFIRHIWSGIILFILSILSYLIIDEYTWTMILFLMGMSNLIVTTYYITVLVGYIDKSL